MTRKNSASNKDKQRFKWNYINYLMRKNKILKNEIYSQPVVVYCYLSNPSLDSSCFCFLSFLSCILL